MMKMAKRILFFPIVLFFAPSIFAGIYMGTDAQQTPAYTGVDVPSTTYIPAGGYPTSTVPPTITCQKTANPTGPACTLPQPPVVHYYKVTSGSLKTNVEHLVNQSGWGRVVWNSPYDYRWVGNMTIKASSIQGALNQLLKPYPLQAIFYKKNHIIAIVPRRAA